MRCLASPPLHDNTLYNNALWASSALRSWSRSVVLVRVGWLVEWGFYALSASKAIFRARTYNCNLFSPVMMMNETRRKPTTGRQSPSLFDKWHGILYMPSRIDEAGHTKAFDYPVAEHWGESQRTKRSLVGFELTSAHTYESEIQRSTTDATPVRDWSWNGMSHSTNCRFL